MRKVICLLILTIIFMMITPSISFAHQRCVTLEEMSAATGGHTDGVVNQTIANGQEPHDPAGLGIYFATRYSPAISDCR